MDKLYVIKIKDGMKVYEGFFEVTHKLNMDGDTFITLENGDEVLFGEYASSKFFYNYNVTGNTFMFCAGTKELCHKYAKERVISQISFFKKELERYQKVNECLFP